MQVSHKSLNAETLKQYDKSLYFAMLNWFKDNIYEITKLSFSMGAVEDTAEHSGYIWYINLLGENQIDDIFVVDDICSKIRQLAEKEIYYGDRNGGTTIQLPFGFVQWHQKKMQFHHSHEKLIKLVRATVK